MTMTDSDDKGEARCDAPEIAAKKRRKIGLRAAMKADCLSAFAN
jgi:hypothetical protein